MIELAEPSERDTDQDVIDEIKYFIDRFNDTVLKLKERNISVTIKKWDRPEDICSIKFHSARKVTVVNFK